MRSKAIKPEQVEYVAKELHQYLSYVTHSVYHTIEKLNDPEKTPEEQEKSRELLMGMLSTANMLYEDLDEKQQGLMNDLAITLLDGIRKC